MAGAISISNSSYYLYTGNYYWSLSPYKFIGSRHASEFSVYSDGSLSNSYVNGTSGGLRPVVSLKLGTEFEDGGEGTILNPYVVKTSE